MKRFAFWVIAALALFLLAFLGLNLFDAEAGPANAAPTELTADLEPGNGFLLLWGFAEPAESDPLSEPYRGRVRDLLASAARSHARRSPYGQWLARLNESYRQNWLNAAFYFPQLQAEDVCAFFASRRGLVAERQARFDTLLQRWRRLLRAEKLDDFTPLNWECPGRSLALATHTAKLFAAAQALAALDGGWLEAGADLLDLAAAGFRLIASGRTLAVNALGRGMVELSLRTLASLLNQPSCPAELARLVLQRLPEQPVAGFGTARVRECNALAFEASIARIKREQVVSPFLLKDFFRDPVAFYALERFLAISGPRVFAVTHALAAFFLQANETAALMRRFWDGIGRLEAAPPWQWREGSPWPRRGPLGPDLDAPLWWLRNPLGKMMVRSAVPYGWPIIRHYVNRSHELKARYDLTRLLARARLAAGGGAGLDEAALRRLLAEGGNDPFSGRPFRFSRGEGALYSLGADGRDNDGRERLEAWSDSDIAVPIRFVSSQLRDDDPGALQRKK